MLETSLLGCIHGVYRVKEGQAPNPQQTALLVSINRKTGTDLEHLLLHLLDLFINIARFQRVEDIADPVGQLHTLSLTKTTGGNGGGTHPQTQYDKRRPRNNRH